MNDKNTDALLKLINNLWAIAFADKHLDKYEEYLIRKISDLLYVSHSDFIQQKLNPTPPDPIQAKIFMFFPLFLTVILAPFPSGLVIYWTINNILTMAQQIVIIKRTTVKTV